MKNRNTFRMSLAASLLSASMGFGGAAHAGEADGAISRHTFRGIRSGTADQLARTRIDADNVRIIHAQPLRGDGTATVRLSSTASSASSTLLGAGHVVGAPMRSAMASVEPAVATVAAVRQAAPLVAASAVASQPAAAYNNGGYQVAHVSHESARLALAAHRVQTVGYANTYGTYSPASYHGRLAYSYAPQTYYRPTTYYASVAYGSPRYYSTGYCAPTYYRPAYSYCAPTYYGGYYGYSHYRPGYSFGYSYGNRCGSSWGFSIRW